MKHTSGPWKCNTGDKDEYDDMAIYDDNNGWVANVIFNSDMQDEGIAEANANLIAATPELFKVCNDFLNYYDGKDKPKNLIDVLIPQLRQVIKKAKGV